MLKEVKCTRWSDAFNTVDRICNDFLDTIPLIVILGLKSMQPRHWKALINVTNKKNFILPCNNEATPLGDVLTMDLLKFSHDMEEICNQGSKEDKMEMSLQEIEECWSSIDLIMTPLKKDGDNVEAVPMLGIGEEDFELLENDQLLINQGMMAS